MSRITRSRRRTRGQALVEFAYTLPFLMLLTVGTFDLGRFVSDSTIAAAQARAGMDTVVLSQTSDVGNAIRNEAGSQFANTPGVWGTTSDTCTTINTTTCGDTGGCTIGDTWWKTTYPNATACFAVGDCTLASGPPATCSPITYGSRPAAGSSNVAVVVTVVTKYSPATPMISQFSNGGAFYVTRTLYGSPLY